MVVFEKITSKRIPTILGLIVLIAGLGGGLYLVGKATIMPRASAEETPKEIKITNIMENSFTVSWVTEISTTGFLRYGQVADNLDQTSGDDRDQLSGEVGQFVTHHVTIRNLKPETNYFFKLGSGTKRVLYDNSGQPYTIKTPAVLSTPPPADTVYGTIMATESAPAEGVIVYLTLPGGSPLSAVAKSSGNWAVSLSTSRTSDLSTYVAYDRQATTLELFVQGGNNRTATAITVTANDAPVPPITLGKTHDFRSDIPISQDQEATPGALPPGADLQSTNLPEAQEASAGAAPAPEASGSGGFAAGSLPGGKLAADSTYKLEILNPEKEGEEVATTKPEIFGNSPKDITLTIVVESPTKYTDEIEVGTDGKWDWTPPAGLAPGTHTVTVSYTDSNGLLQTVKRSFVVAAAGGTSLPAFESTPSGKTATTSASASPSAAPRVSMPSTQSGVPTAGVLTPTLVLFILGAGLLSVGIFWQLKINT